ncbi:hypothetical protein PLICRDRAFT_104957 [Plicaturopsis crispa FD-325 SS-3]|nr:hypothetical protein PLICRDRAFT_104957 [Plicaturopsis crispa FD-325 SS-3]
MHALATVLALAAAARAGVHEIWYNVTYVDDVNPDALFPRRAIGVNGSWPPPPVDMSATDDLLVHVTNGLDQPTTIHHHGMFFQNASYMDGALAVSQCGIPPGATFDYSVPVASSGQWGTYWWHAHANGQYPDGLRAPLVIHPEGSSRKHGRYDAEYTVVLGDWYHAQHSELLEQFISLANPGGAEPVPDSALIYFANGTQYLPAISGTSDYSGVGFNENATLAFEAGKTYRLRVINTSAFAAFYFWIDGHDMRVIEADGTDVEEYPIDLISVTVAQRYSVLVTARNDSTPANWAVHANMDTDMFDTVPDALQPNITSSITYSAGAPITDSGPISTYHDVPDLSLVPSSPTPLPPATTTITIEATFDTMDDGTNHAMFNKITYNPPLVPAVFSELSLGGNATEGGAYGPLSWVVGRGDVVDIVIQNGDAGKHPFHLHGHKSILAGRADDYTSDDPTLNPPLNESQPNPMRRDTVQIPSGSSATLRVVADNPGVWLLHCHIEWHLQVGLAMQLIEAPLSAQSSLHPPQFMYDHCASLSTPSTGNAAGHASTTDLSGLALGPYPQVLGWHPRGIGAMAGCVLSAVLGMCAVVWYALVGGVIGDEEVEREERERLAQKDRRGRFWGLGGKRGVKAL